MNERLRDEVAAELDGLRAANTYKTFLTLLSPQGPVVEMEGRGEVLVLSSNNYLGLAAHPAVIEATKDGLDRYGAGTASVRFICGTFEAHHELEAELAELVGTEAALTYASCWNANEAVIPSLTDEHTVLISDELNHASIVDAMRLAKPARKVVFAHSDMDELRDALRSCDAGAAEDRRHRRGVQHGGRRRAAARDRRAGPRARRDRDRGRLARDGRHGRHRARRGGALRPARRDRRDHEHAREGPRRRLGRFRRLEPRGLRPPRAALAAAALLERDPAAGGLRGAGRSAGTRERAWSRRSAAREHPHFRDQLREVGFRPLDGEGAIIPIIVGETAFAIELSRRLLDEGVFVTGFGYPVVPEGKARIRVQMSAALEPEHLDRALAAFEKVGHEAGLLVA